MEQNKQNIQVPSPEQPLSVAPAKNNKLIWILAGAVALLLVAGGVFAYMASQNKQTTTQQNTETPAATPQIAFKEQYGQGCKESDVAFTSPPMKMEELAYIRPLGAMSDGHVTPTDHVYIGGPNRNVPDNTYAVLMPADGTVSTVSAMPAQYIGDRQGQQVAQEDHRLVISHSCRYYSIFIHIHKLGDKLKAAVGTLQPNENKQANVELKAGEVVGYIGGDTFDWTPIDTSVTLKGFMTPKLYEGESWKVHTVSPFDLYTGQLKTDLEAKSLRTVAPVGGKIDYDEPGKLIGTWFKEGTGGYSGTSQNGGRYWDGHLSVVPDYIDPTATIVSIGNWNGNAQQFLVSGTVDPAKIAASDSTVKYELTKLNYVTENNQAWTGSGWVKGLHPSQNESVQGTILLQVMDGEKLKVETFPGKTAAQVSGFTPAAATYER